MNVAHLVPAYNAGNVGMINLVFQVWRLWGGGAFLPAWEHGVTLVRIAVLGATCLAVLGARERTPLLGASALLLAHFLTYPHVWEHHMSAVILLGAAWEATGLAGTRHRGAALVCLALLAAPLPSGLLALEDAAGLAAGHRHPLAPLLAALSKALPTLGLYGIAMRRLLAQGIAWPAHR
jgi:hypothetical protein